MSRLIQPFDLSRHGDYLCDESMARGCADSICFPAGESDVQQVVKTLYNQKVPVTVQGSRTGLAGKAVPQTGLILNLSAMNRITGMEINHQGQYCLRVQPGVTLADLNRQVASRRFDNVQGWDQASLNVLEMFQKKPSHWFFPPDPTEDTASLGGMAATDAHGICAHYYGPTHRYIQAARAVDSRGRVHVVTRGQYPLDPPIGSRGRPGVISELTLKLLPLPSRMWGIMFFFTALDQAAGFIETLMSKQGRFADTWTAGVEIMDRVTLEAIEAFKQEHAPLKVLPPVDKKFAGAVYLELHGNREDAMTSLAEWVMATAGDFGGDPDDTWAFCSHVDLPRIRLFRQAAPRAAHHLAARARQSDSRIVMLGTDMILPGICLTDLIHRYQTDMADAGLKGAIFGHAADNRLHVNLLPENYEAFVTGKNLIRHWAGNGFTKW
jgi:D-lactate dehydrogenase (cytochrome)